MTALLPLYGTTALITGASRGLGLAIASKLSSLGANLAVVARVHEDITLTGQLLQAQCPTSHQQVISYAADLAEIVQVERAFQYCNNALGNIDILVNNAAIQGPIGSLEQIAWQDWQHVIQVDLFAVVRLCQLAIPNMRKHNYGRIINISGGGATGPRPDFSAYAAAKSAIVRLSETLATELVGTGITVNSVAPGAMNTRMLTELLEAGPQAARHEYTRALNQQTKGGTPPEQAAELVAWLAGPQGAGITGRLISAVWDNWMQLEQHAEELKQTDIYTLRRIVPEDRGKQW